MNRHAVRHFKPRRAARAIRSAPNSRAARQRRHHSRRGSPSGSCGCRSPPRRRCPRCPPPRPKGRKPRRAARAIRTARIPRRCPPASSPPPPRSPSGSCGSMCPPHNTFPRRPPPRPKGNQNRAALPVPSALPGSCPGVPASVVTTPAGVTFRIVWLPVSAT